MLSEHLINSHCDNVLQVGGDVMKYSVLIQVNRGLNQKLAAWLAIVVPVHDVQAMWKIQVMY